MDSSTTAASTDQEQLENTQFLPKATVYAVGATYDENDDAGEKNGGAGASCTPEEDRVEPAGGSEVDLPLGRSVSPPLPVPTDVGEWHSHCELAEPQRSTEAAVKEMLPAVKVPEVSEELAVAERLMFITALAPSGEEGVPAVEAAAAAAAAAEINQVAENHNTLATIVSDHGATTINGAQQQQQQQIVYIHGASTAELVESSTAASVTTASPSTLVHCGTYPNNNVVRIQIIPVDQCEQQQQQ
uniref:Uncharacterized protein n=1 Tax=Anopheles maculatus TaxID=74869 RepID=A0A182TB98_9DIPT